MDAGDRMDAAEGGGLLLFVYGSLKQGYPNCQVNTGRRVGGAFVTRQAWPLWLLHGRLPVLLQQPGQGLQVRGELYRADAAALAAMDALERIGQPGGYTRGRVQVQALDGAEPEAAPVEAWAYCWPHARHEQLLAEGGMHLGPLDEYTPAHGQRLRW